MRTLPHLFENNRRWAESVSAQDPTFFSNLSQQQAPDYLWIGCADSRVPANQIVDLMPGSVFVHRNVANVIVHTDLNALSVLQYAVEVLKVRDVIVCGHYGCGGVRAAMENMQLGLIDNWLRHIQDVATLHQEILSHVTDPNVRHDRLCELNVIEQVINVSRTTIVQQAWQRQQPLTVHGWIYSLNDGLLRDLSITISTSDEVVDMHGQAMYQMRQRIQQG